MAFLEPHMEASDEDGKGRIVIATVKGDVHDIGKNLVDIILSNNGYEVVNIGIKQPIATILDVALDKKADVIGMSGLLVKSTVVMKDNLKELQRTRSRREVPGSARWCGAHALLRRERSSGGVRGRRQLCPRRVRRPELDGPDHDDQARRRPGAGQPGGHRCSREGCRA